MMTESKCLREYLNKVKPLMKEDQSVESGWPFKIKIQK